jgi:hypothetical protein
LIGLYILGLIVGDEEQKSVNSSNVETTSSTVKVEDEYPEIDPNQLLALERYLNEDRWICLEVESGYAPFMKGATFKFERGFMHVVSGDANATNNFQVKAIMENMPEGALYSALVNVNKNTDLLTLIDPGLLVLSWGGDKAKLILKRL